MTNTWEKPWRKKDLFLVHGFRGFSLSLVDSIALSFKQSNIPSVYNIGQVPFHLWWPGSRKTQRKRSRTRCDHLPRYDLQLDSTPKVSTTSPSSIIRWWLRLQQIILCVILLIQTNPFININFLWLKSLQKEMKIQRKNWSQVFLCWGLKKDNWGAISLDKGRSESMGIKEELAWPIHTWSSLHPGIFSNKDAPFL